MRIHSISNIPNLYAQHVQNIKPLSIGSFDNGKKNDQSVNLYSTLSKPCSTGFCNYSLNFGMSRARKFSTEKENLAEWSSKFQVSHHSGITCPACGKKMLCNNDFKDIERKLDKLNPDEYLDFLGQYREYMRPVEESVFDEIYAKSQEPGASKDIRTLLVGLRNSKMPILQKAQLTQIKKMRRLARTLPEDEQRVLLTKLDRLQQIVRKTNAEAPFRRKIMIDKISRIHISDTDKYKRLRAITESFPTSKDMNSAWIVKYSGKDKNSEDWTSHDIALRFLSSSVANTDHILAYDIENNHDDISNYMSMHNACNSHKSNMTFLRWFNEDKSNRLEYMKQYLKDAQALIDSGKITDIKYKHYVAYATQTLYEASKGRVNLYAITS